jgi:hypothetical protein
MAIFLQPSGYYIAKDVYLFRLDWVKIIKSNKINFFDLYEGFLAIYIMASFSFLFVYSGRIERTVRKRQ